MEFLQYRTRLMSSRRLYKVKTSGGNGDDVGNERKGEK